MSSELAAFRLGDVRGVYPDDIDESFAIGFAHAFAERFGLHGQVATGRDMRESSPALQGALNEGLRQAGLDVVDLGLCTTELGYFASTRGRFGATIVVTASHNAARYNGFKCVLTDGAAVTFESGLSDVRELMRSGYRREGPMGSLTEEDLHPEYIGFLETCFDIDALRARSIALNGLNGTAATLADALATRFGLPVTWFRQQPGPIPREGADPANPRLVAQMQTFMAGGGFDLGVAWDGDCDRCVFYDGDGNLMPTYYMVGLLAETFLSSSPGAAVVFDTKLQWNTLEIIGRLGGVAVPSETGHAFMKRHMRQTRAIYGGELSSHHYFGDFFGCDSGMFAWLKLVELLASAGESLGSLVADRRAQICCTPEISLALTDAGAALAAIETEYEPRATRVAGFDGPSYEMPGDWRFSLRRSKTEPLVRINFESRGRPDVLLEEARGMLSRLRPWLMEGAEWESRLHTQ